MIGFIIWTVKNHHCFTSLTHINKCTLNRDLAPIYTVLDLHDHDIKLNSSTTCVALTLTIVLQNLTSSHRKKR